MRLRHILTRGDTAIRDFANHQIDCMIVGPEVVKGRDPRPTHLFAGGWRYKLELVQLEGAAFLRISGQHDKLGAAVRYVPAACCKELNPWTADDQAWEDAQKGTKNETTKR